MGALTDLLKGERGLFGIVLVIAVTIFVCLGKITFQQWQDFSLWVFGIFAAGKTVTTSMGLMTGAVKTDPPKEP